MMPETFEAVCKVLERPWTQAGCWLPEDIPGVIEKLQAEIDREKKLLDAQKARMRELELERGRRYSSYAQEDQEEKERERAREHVSFAMRVFPLMQMLRAADKKGVKVMWGVP